MLYKRNELSSQKVQDLSVSVIDRLTATEEYKNSKNIFVFVSTNNEVSTHNFIKNSIYLGKNIYIPYVNSEKKSMLATKLDAFEDLEMGFYDILSLPKSKLNEVNPENLDLIVVPGLIFGKNFYRIGYGGGYYDKYLSNNNIKATKIGICFEFQIVDKVEFDIFDIPVDMIITEKEEYERRK